MKIIGSIGLGAMGGAYAKFLLEDSHDGMTHCLASSY